MSCDEIAKTFAAARDRLSSLHYSQVLQQEIDPNLHGWLKSSYMDLIQRQTHTDQLGGSSSKQLRVEEEGQVQVQEIINSTMDPGRPASSSRPTRRRKDEAEKTTVTVPAPLHGNTELPPEDGFTWRKYGQKEILGSKFPRGYYRCTHQKMYQCPAKKQVQRLDNDPYMFAVTYRGTHTCHMSSTAPSIAPSQPDFTGGIMAHTSTMTTTTTTAPPSITPAQQWLSMEYRGGGVSRGASTPAANDSDAAGPSTSGQYGPNTVTDMVDVMFNSGSSSTTNSIDFIFHSLEDKWDHNLDDDKDN
ncbi:hypothetical protein ACFE04_017193 [Oxalis oulophora]